MLATIGVALTRSISKSRHLGQEESFHVGR